MKMDAEESMATMDSICSNVKVNVMICDVFEGGERSGWGWGWRWVAGEAQHTHSHWVPNMTTQILNKMKKRCIAGRHHIGITAAVCVRFIRTAVVQHVRCTSFEQWCSGEMRSIFASCGSRGRSVILCPGDIMRCKRYSAWYLVGSFNQICIFKYIYIHPYYICIYFRAKRYSAVTCKIELECMQCDIK